MSEPLEHQNSVIIQHTRPKYKQQSVRENMTEKIEFIAATWEFLIGDFSLKQKEKKWN